MIQYIKTEQAGKIIEALLTVRDDEVRLAELDNVSDFWSPNFDDDRHIRRVMAITGDEYSDVDMVLSALNVDYMASRSGGSWYLFRNPHNGYCSVRAELGNGGTMIYKADGQRWRVWDVIDDTPRYRYEDDHDAAWNDYVEVYLWDIAESIAEKLNKALNYPN